MENSIILEQFYDIKLIILSILVAIFGSYITLFMNRRIALMKGYSRVMIAFTSLVMGMTVWAMHFIGMSSFSLKVIITYNWLLTILSIVPALFASFVAFTTLYVIVSRWWATLFSSIVIGLGISGMHYAGMAAITSEGFMVYDTGLVILSILFAIGVAFLGLYLLRQMKNVHKTVALMQPAIIIGVGVSGMHYLGMLAMEFHLPEENLVALQSAPVVSFDILGIILAAIVCTSLFLIFGYIQSRHVAIRKVAYQDVLTGLPNRHWVHQFMGKETEHLHRHGGVLYLLIDIDQFQWINETFGYRQGDELLREFADYLSENKKSGDIVIRYAGNQFLCMTPIEEGMEVNEEVLRYHDTLKRPFSIGGTSIHVFTTIGATISGDKEDIPFIFGNLEQALQYGKNQGKNRYVVYDSSLHSNRREREIEEYIKQDVADGMKGFSLVIQPKFQLPEVSIAGAEVLVRWYNEELGHVPPGEFIPVTERNGTIQHITMWVLKEALCYMKQWKLRGFDISSLSINLSTVHFQIEDANDMLFQAFEDMNVDPASGWLEVEVTETAVMNNLERATVLLEELRQKGIRIALDDFGSGLSSFMYLKKMPIHTLKLDKSLMDGVPYNEKDNILLEVLLDMAERLNLEMVTEGIEDTVQHKHLISRKLIVQGYYYARPLPVKDFENMHLLKKKDA
ncbi:putative bifunctional diguanylate cyclase/phosphodiesterase [Salimicrobium flavidum]|uniref:putative bifunctional diguanylate cyclase/phosphodiesterase n=1 Tax=Salimicrobium flavidum TaxID=570947 RepID=UPI000970954F|nr:EAL domain-containing protein [Salimicrobium flavidum]